MAETDVRVLLVDDHPMVREGLRSMLAVDGVVVVGEAGTGVDAVRAARTLAPDLILLDMELPDLDGVAVLRELKSCAPGAAVLVVSMHDDPRLVRRAVDAGAAGYVLKGASRRELLAAVTGVRDGESVLDPRLLRALVAEVGRATTGPPTAPLGEALTAVEREVLALIADGLTNREIGERMRWSVATAKKYVQRILDKLAVSDRTQAAVAAVRRGLLA
jgi:DNA-binding NarL/FixJ family response regulator